MKIMMTAKMPSLKDELAAETLAEKPVRKPKALKEAKVGKGRKK